KTTLMRIAFGMVRPDVGRISLDGHDLQLHSPADAIALGIGMVHQHFTLVPAMTVAENIALGGHGRLHREDAVAAVRRIADATGFALDADARVEDLPVGAQQRVEIAKALARRARIIVLDEPTAVLAPAEADDLLRWLRSYVAEGNAAVLITHKLREALAIADDVTVLRHGRVRYAGGAAEASTASVTEAMLGSDVSRLGLSPTSAPPVGEEEIFRADKLSLRDERGVMVVRDASFVVRAAEIVGVAGVEGAGQRELLRALAGRHEVAGGRLVRPAAVGFVPEDRHRDAVLLDRPLVENVALRGAGSRRGIMAWSTLESRTATLLQHYDVRAGDSRALMRTLSGGNQQKLVLAREMDAIDETVLTPQAIVAENPTRGLDVRATADVHARLRAARDRGAAVVVYSSDLDEILSLASRVLVAYAGTVREVAPDREAAGRAMLGLS
ncbi:MAG TPA: ATP-binding cassette domain-containing protein, partial [Gemmatimonadaceae bacterium]|nr:ATP-binding cassette domain-containing protein [Gemmatimonadaceae bacterium]